MTANKPTAKTKPAAALPLSQAEALDILTTALQHCREAGLRMRWGQVLESWVLSMPNVEMVDGTLLVVEVPKETA